MTDDNVDYTFTSRRVAQLYVEKWVNESPDAANGWLNANYTREEQESLLPYLSKCFAKYNLIYTPPPSDPIVA